MDTLDQLEHQILLKLEMLAEGRSSEYGKLNVHRAHPSSTPPPGFENGVSAPLTSLMEFHKEKMLRARERALDGPVSVRLMAIATAFADFDYAVKRPPTFNSPDSDENTEDRDTAILVHFEGSRPEWPAAYMGCSSSHVEKLRRRNHRDAILGEHIARTEAFA